MKNCFYYKSTKLKLLLATVLWQIRMLADTNGEFTKAVGLDQDLAVLGGLRSKRYSMLVEDGRVLQLNVEPDGKGLSCSLAENTMSKL